MLMECTYLYNSNTYSSYTELVNALKESNSLDEAFSILYSIENK
jgi:hypothetical protein